MELLSLDNCNNFNQIKLFKCSNVLDTKLLIFLQHIMVRERSERFGLCYLISVVKIEKFMKRAKRSRVNHNFYD